MNDFVKKSDYAFLFLPLESYPTYALPRNVTDPAVGNFITQVLHGAPTATEIVAPERRSYAQRMAEFSDGTQKLFFRFG